MNLRKDLIDLLVTQFWADGYKIIHRKFGNYLTDPPLVGNYTIDILARKGNKFAIGLILQENDLRSSDLARMLAFLGSRKSKFANSDALLYIGVEPHLYVKLAAVMHKMDADMTKNIRSFPLQLIPEMNLFSNPSMHTPAATAFFR